MKIDLVKSNFDDHLIEYRYILIYMSLICLIYQICVVTETLKHIY